MGSPFATAAAPASLIVPATDGQLRFIATLLAERDWKTGQADKYIIFMTDGMNAATEQAGWSTYSDYTAYG